MAALDAVDGDPGTGSIRENSDRSRILRFDALSAAFVKSTIDAVPIFSTRGASDSHDARALLAEAFEERVQQLTILSDNAPGSLTSAEGFDYELKNFHAIDADTVAGILGSSSSDGLSPAAAAVGLQKYGPNALQPPREWPLIAKFTFAMFSGFAPLLWVGSLASFIAWQPLGGANPSPYNLGLACLLLVIIFVGGVFVFWQEYQTARVLAGFKSMIPTIAQVTRGGTPLALPTSELTVGDLVQLTAGAKVPADVRIVGVQTLKVDNSMLTGEAEPVKLLSEPQTAFKNSLEARCMAFMGASVVEGSGTALVVAVGANCQIGRIAKMASAPPKTSSLQADLNRFVFIVACFAVSFFILTLAVWGLWIRPYHPSFMPAPAALSNALGVLVALVPEGLPLALAAGLTVIAKRLCDKHAVMLKQLATVETLGSMSLLASDKTGTLTQNVMTVVNIVIGPSAKIFHTVDMPARAPSAASASACDGFPSAFSRLVREAALCNDSMLQSASDPISPSPSTPVVVGGNCTDKALLSWALSAGVSAELPAWRRVVSIPFSSVTKQAVAVCVNLMDGLSTVFVKGAPDFLLGRCDAIYNESGALVPLYYSSRAALAAALETLGRQGQRVLALCERPLPSSDFPPGFIFSTDPEPNFPLDKLALVGFVAISDPPRSSTAPAVAALREAGVQVVMVTGDAETTAEAIARQVGIITFPTVHCPERDFWGPPSALVPIQDAPANARTLRHARLGTSLRPSQSTYPLSARSLSTAAAGNTTVPFAVLPAGPVTASPSNAAVVATGPELAHFSPEAWDWLLRHPEIVLARTTPEQKLAFVQAAQKNGQRVGVTGDGMNDAPALKNADVGVAMNSGSDAARDAAHAVLLTDDFSAMVHAVREGRLLFANLRKICAYLITGGCWCELLPVLANFFLGVPTPLSAFLMIYISCVTDVCAGIALIYEGPEGAIMQGKARDHRSTSLVDFGLVLNQYLFTGTMISFATFFNFFLYMAERAGPGGPSITASSSSDPTNTVLSYPPNYLVFVWGWEGDADENAALRVGTTVFFITIVLCQLANYMNVRRRCSPYFSDFVPGRTPFETLRSLLAYMTPSWPVIGTFIGEIGFALVVSEIPGAQEAFGTGTVPGRYWGVAVGFALLVFAVSEAGKWWLRAHPQSPLRVLFWK